MLQFLLLLLGSIGVLFTCIYLFFQHKYQHWKKRNISYVKPTFPFGSVKGANSERNVGMVFKDLYFKTKHHPLSGAWMLFTPSILINDPELIKTIFVKEFGSFQDRGVYVNKEGDPLAAHLFSISGTDWRNLRVKLTPTFTSGKMKYMFQTIADIGIKLQDYLKEPAERNEVLEVKNVLARFTMDVISSCAFGIDSESIKDPDSIYLRMGQKFFDQTPFGAFLQMLTFVVPDVARWFKLKVTPKDTEKFFLKTFKDTVEYRSKNNIQRKDFMQMLIKLMEQGYVDDADSSKHKEKSLENGVDTQKFTMNEAAAQAFVFFLAGFETSSTAMQFTLYELALNPDIQDKTRKDIRDVLAKHNGHVTYEAIQEMHYLDRVVSETLRKHPPAPLTNRECAKKFTVPGTDYVIDKGIILTIPIYALHNDPEYWPQPERFDPDRFLPEKKDSIRSFTYLPFGEGPRNCIGNRFALLQTKVGLISVFSKYKVEVCEKTLIPMDYQPSSFVLSPKGGMHLRFGTCD